MYASYLNLPLDYVVLGGLVSGEPKLPRAAQLSQTFAEPHMVYNNSY